MNRLALHTHKRKPLRVVLFILPALAVIGVICLGLYHAMQPQPVWFVEDRCIAAWEKTLAASPSPLLNAKIIPLSAGEAALPGNGYGYRISSAPEPQEPDGNESPVRVYRGLSSGQQGDALLLAVNPWLIFRKYTSPPLSRDEAENGPAGKGLIFMAGADPAASAAWTAQLLQEAPGVFPRDRALWEQANARLYSGKRFQSGAQTYSWGEILTHLLSDGEDIRVYAPLSRIRALPVHETNILEADVFPGRRGWTEFGIQVEIIRAVPYGSRKSREKLESATVWLKSVEVQSRFADALGWLAAHPEAPPYNPVSQSARRYWFTASYIWEMDDNER